MGSERGNTLMRSLDARVGIPGVALLGALRRLRRRTRPDIVRRVGFLRTGGIGDIVLLSGVIQDVAAAGVEVHLFTGGANAAAGRLIPGVTRVVQLPMTRPHQAIRLVREIPLDIVIDSGQWPRIDAVLAATARARWTVGFRAARQHRHFAYDAVVEHSPELHELENFRRLVAAAGFRTGSPPRLTVGEPVPPALAPSAPYVVCHLWSGGFMGHRKEWPLDRWQQVIAAVTRMGHQVVLTGGPETVAGSGDFAGRLGRDGIAVHDLAGRLSLAQVLGLLRGSALVISVNTGIMHMAAAADVPVISLEGPVPVRRWGPVGARATSVVSRHPGAGYLNLGWEYDGAAEDTMTAIEPDRVIGEVTRVLEGATA